MNTYYKFNSISNIETEDKHRIRRTASSVHIVDRLLAFIYGIMAIIISQKALKIIKVSLSAIGFIGFFGIIGGMEKGSLGMISGLLLCALITAVEFVILKNLSGKEEKGQ